MIKRLLISVLGGGALAWLTYLYINTPSNGPRLVTIVFIVPMQLLASAITKDRDLGEIVFWSLIVLFYSTVVFGVYWVIAGLLGEIKKSKGK